MSNRRWYRLVSMFMAAFLAVFSMVPQTVLAEDAGSTVLIRSAEDFLDFSKKCTLDSWSRGKNIVLTADIDLTSTDFAPVPIFGGSFHGNGHKITGLTLEDGNSYQGLFRFVDEGGLIEDLSVSGNIAVSGVQEYIGGIAGSVSGTVRNCTFEGVVDGKLYVGGIAGINESSGRIEDCKVQGFIQGEKYVGGIAGQNEGLVYSCENQARVNPVTNEEDSDLEMKTQPGVTDSIFKRTENTLNNAENSAKITQDTGGIAGFSKGVIKNCRNAGTVGYPHVGYNVGGIVGRSMGYLTGCSNIGKILGRKDVGGIAGQLAPDIRLVFSTDTLDRLDKELTALSDLADNAMDHTDGNREVISGRLDKISDYAKTASDDTSDLADMTIDWADANIEEINDMMDTIDETVDRLEEISWSLEGVLDTMNDGIESLEEGMDEAGSALGVGKQGEKKMRDLINKLRLLNNSQKESVSEIRELSKNFVGALASGNIASASDATEAIKDQLDELLKSAGESRELLSQFKNLTADLPDIGIKLKRAAGDLDDAADSMGQAAHDMEDVAGQTRKLFRNIADKDEVRFLTLGDDFKEKGDQIHDTIDAISDQMDLLRNEMDSTGDTLSGDMRDLKDQLRVIGDILDDAADEARDWEKDDLWDDVSEAEIHSTTTGKAESCKNSGAVEGDINVGGIVGAMAVEKDLDPEDDIEEVGSDSFKFHYETRAILYSCENCGTVTAKKDGAGGAVGRMDLGYILNCRNYGNVESTDGSYVGGIAGSSGSTIRGSYSKCMLSGKNFVGGIAGDAYDLCDNVAFVSIPEAEMYSGAIAGRIDKEGNVTGNRFVENGAAGIDGISYAGKAEPVSYAELMAEEGTPEEFGKFTLVYMADDEIAARVACVYGDRISDLASPAVPEKKGYYGVWETADEETVTFDHIFKAIYTPHETTLASEAMRDPVRPVILAEGTFSQNASLEASLIAGDEESEQWKIILTTETENGEKEGTFRFRFIAPAEWRDVSLTLITDSGEIPVTWERVQSACVFTADQTEFVLLAGKKVPVAGRILAAAVITAAAAAAALLFALLVKRRKKNK